ncbi:hypothetical protein Mal15_46340 [Stieleria maiorica]|uniref:Secreted protein n=1 Tax=Stieleria maiorica TaxID=2795974 RepID=A0A5B9MH01_9BACT|nr:hypothetical protein [Stieleria maiorica]QEG00563.1 hypothetical protein Mal15_46340 [Stieleria maiorica]
MKQAWTKSAVALLMIAALVLCGCGPSKEPTGPEEGSIQAYLDANPEAAARIDEDDESEEDDGTGE